MTEAIERLYAKVMSSRDGDPAKSYTASLFQRGRQRIAQKLGEEAIETVLALTGDDPDAVVAESADLLYHLAVAWASAGIEPADVWAELERREGMSGLAEKASRSK